MRESALLSIVSGHDRDADARGYATISLWQSPDDRDTGLSSKEKGTGNGLRRDCGWSRLGGVRAGGTAFRNPHRSVLLLEAGPDYPDLDSLPEELKHHCLEAASQAHAPHNWSFVNAPIHQQQRTAPSPRGKVVGGSSAI